MDKYTFPAIFQPEENGNGYTVTFPDLPGCITEGDDLEEALSMAQEALEGFLWGMEQDDESIPAPSRPEQIAVTSGSFVAPIHAWMDAVREEMDNKAVKKTLTIPKWLNDAAEKENVNFSQILQLALKNKLGIRNRRL